MPHPVGNYDSFPTNMDRYAEISQHGLANGLAGVSKSNGDAVQPCNVIKCLPNRRDPTPSPVDPCSNNGRSLVGSTATSGAHFDFSCNQNAIICNNGEDLNTEFECLSMRQDIRRRNERDYESRGVRSTARSSLSMDDDEEEEEYCEERWIEIRRIKEELSYKSGERLLSGELFHEDDKHNYSGRDENNGNIVSRARLCIEEEDENFDEEEDMAENDEDQIDENNANIISRPGDCIEDMDSDDDKAENDEEEDMQGGEQKKFSKSYWRKQRRLRLKERLLAEKMLMEANLDLAAEEKENLKPQKGVKSKEIDYDSYLPAHVLMHVKRDLVSVLMEYGQTREVKVSFEDMERSGPHHASRFHTAAIVDSETFPVGSGSSKKNAKKAAAAQALKIMYDRGRKNLEVVNEVAHKKLKAMSDEEVGSHAHRVVLVSRHVLDTAEETQFINYSKDKIAATFVLEYHGRMRVVGLGTGNRCMLYQHLTLDGKRIIHSHAEIIARRAFLRYLYKQLLTYNGNRSHPIFTRSDTGKMKLRDKIQVHLYISRPPCGDAAAFPTISNFPNKMRAIRKQGQLRTIIDDGEGAIPTDFPVPAGANGKERLRIMTCSDKICRWNVLGVQGAMLSHFLDPIYISSMVIGSHTGDQRGHVPRAVSGRLKCGRLHEVIQRPYHINTPDIHYPHDDLADNYNITKSKQYCITWSYGDVDAEVIDAITGVTNMETMEDVIPSRVSKIILYGLFQQVCNKYGQHDLACLDYLKAKRAATTFQRMKSFVGQHLAAMGFGQWYSLQDTYGTDSLACPGPC